MSKKSKTSSIDMLTVGMAPAVAMGNSYCNLSFAEGMSAINMVFAQQQQCMQFHTATAKCISVILGQASD